MSDLDQAAVEEVDAAAYKVYEECGWNPESDDEGPKTIWSRMDPSIKSSWKVTAAKVVIAYQTAMAPQVREAMAPQVRDAVDKLIRCVQVAGSDHDISLLARSELLVLLGVEAPPVQDEEEA